MSDRVQAMKERAAAIARAGVNPATALLDSMIRAHFAMARDTEAQVADLIKSYNALEVELLAENTRLFHISSSLRQREGDRPSAVRLAIDVRRERLDMAVRRMQEQTADAYLLLKDETKAAASQVGKDRQREIGRAFRDVGSDLGFTPDLSGALTPFQLRAVVREEVMGQTLTDWFKIAELKAQLGIAQQMRIAFASGDSMDEAASRILGHVSRGRDEAKMIARTLIMGVANEAAHDLYDANDDVLAGKQWVATLDGRTCPACGPLDGRVWYYRRSPRIDSMPRAPLHPSCRCFAVPVPKGFPVLETPTWSDWIVRQPRGVQAKVLGSRVLEDLIAGKVSARDTLGPQMFESRGFQKAA